MICERCGTETNAWIVSIFNTDAICLDCKTKESEHPEYERARAAEGEAVLRGDLNFPGVGLPADL